MHFNSRCTFIYAGLRCKPLTAAQSGEIYWSLASILATASLPPAVPH